jgi:hypothetical protein
MVRNVNYMLRIKPKIKRLNGCQIYTKRNYTLLIIPHVFRSINLVLFVCADYKDLDSKNIII